MTSFDVWTIVVAILASVGCSLVGCFLVLKRMSLLGDAISHAVLPGIAFGFLLSGKITGMEIVLGAMAMGMLTTFLTQLLSKAVKVPEDASLGVVFTSLFALGVVLISVKARSVDLDPGCVLYGLIEMTPFDETDLFGWLVPTAVVTLGTTLCLVGASLFLLWKEFKLAAFNPELATSLGFSSSLLHYLLMALTAGVTVAAFEAVGSILVVAMLIVPAATAQLLTDRLRTMVLLASLLATLSSIVGYYAAMYWNTSVAGMMAVSIGCIFLLTLFMAPRYGLLSRALRQLRLGWRITSEDVLGTLFRAEESSGQGLSAKKLIPTRSQWYRSVILRYLRFHGLITRSQSNLSLTESGREKAIQLIRAHRLWEAYLQKNVELPADHLHAPAEKIEHYMGPELLERLASDLDHPVRDPHGREIPVRIR